jgi:autotransporter-associated beta strand protein
LTKEGAGIAALWNPNTYTGATVINGGQLMLAGSGALSTNSAVQIASGASLRLDGYFAPADINRTIGGLTGAGVLYSGGGTVTVNKTSGSDTFSGDIQGGQGLIKSGNGTLVLSGANSYTGVTTVSAGSLIINGNNSAAVGVLSVSPAARLGGSGTIGGATTISGTLAPGNSIGTLTVANDVTWNGGENWVFELGSPGPSLGSPGSSDLLAITGSNDFLKGTGSSWTFDFAGTGQVGWYKLVDWTGGTTAFLASDFSGTNLGGGFNSEFSIQDSALYVNVVPEPSTYALLTLAGLGLFFRSLHLRLRGLAGK